MEMKLPLTNWLWTPDWEQEDLFSCRLVYFRKVLSLPAVPESFKIRISADSRYKLYVNGTLVQIGPSRGDRKVWFLDEAELAPYLKAGENAVAAEVLHYPLEHRKGNFGIFRTLTPGLYVERCGEKKEVPMAALADASGEPFTQGWRCRRAESFAIVSESPWFAPLQILEERTGCAAEQGWKLAGYAEDPQWKDARAYCFFEIDRAVSPGKLLARTIPYMRLDKKAFAETVVCREGQADERAWDALLAGKGTVTVPAGGRAVAEISAGELTTGYLSLRMAGGAGSCVRILTSEGYVKDDEALRTDGYASPHKGDRCDWEHGILHGFTDTYHAGGCGTGEAPEEYAPFWFRTFRFVRLEITAGEEPLTLTGLDYLETGYPLVPTARVETSDETLGPVWDISLRTLRRCMHETYEDCPFYEQLQYAMDSRSQILYTYMVSADDRLARKCMDDFRRSQGQDGLLNSCYPSFGSNVIPGFSIYYILMLYDHMMFFGDPEFLRAHAGAMDNILGYFGRNLDGRGLVARTGGLNGRHPNWSFIDWTSQWDETTGVPRAILSGPITMESFLYILGLKYGAEVMDYLGRHDTAAEYRSRAESVREAVRTHCMGENGMFTDGPGVGEYSQHCQVFAVLTDTVTPEGGRPLLLETLEHPDAYAQCSVAMAYYLFRALEACGLYERTCALWELWRGMVRKNLTTCVEDGVRERSDCHAWGALALYELPAAVLGVRPAAPGFKKIRIRPNPGYFTWARGEAATKWGNVHVEWKRLPDGKVELSYEAPKGVEVEL